MTAWLLLIVAGLCEVVWAVGLKYAMGFTRFWPSVIVVVAMVASIGMLAWAARTLPIGTAYAVWVGIGAVGVALYGIIALGEPATVARIGFISLLVVAIVGLKWVSADA